MILTLNKLHIIIPMIFHLLNKMSTNHDITFFGQTQELNYTPKTTIPIALTSTIFSINGIMNFNI